MPEPQEASPTPTPAPARPEPAAPPPSRPPGDGRREHRGDGRSGFRGPRRRRPDGDEGKAGDLIEKVIFINRSAKVVKGGRRFSFSALVVVGDRKGRVGLGLGKAAEVAEAIKKGGGVARQHMAAVALRGTTIPHEVLYHFGGARVLLKPASEGTGVIAGKTVRAVLDAAGVRNVLSKSLGSKNAANVAKATLHALLQLRLREDIFRARGLPVRVATATAPATPAATPPAPAPVAAAP